MLQVQLGGELDKLDAILQRSQRLAEAAQLELARVPHNLSSFELASSNPSGALRGGIKGARMPSQPGQPRKVGGKRSYVTETPRRRERGQGDLPGVEEYGSKHAKDARSCNTAALELLADKSGGEYDHVRGGGSDAFRTA